MQINEIINVNDRSNYLAAVEQWVDGVDQSISNNVPNRIALAQFIASNTPAKLAPKSKFVYRALTLPDSMIKSLESGKSITLNAQGASSYSSTPALAKWFFDEVLKFNSILIKKPVTQNAILDVTRLRKTMTPEEQSQFELLAYGEDAEVIVLDTPEYLTINPADIVRKK